MNYYLINLIIIMCLWIVIKKLGKFKNADKLFLSIAFFQLFLFLALRDKNVGTDLKNYIPFFWNTSVLPWSDISVINFEIGFKIYNMIISTIFGYKVQIFLAITAFICLIGVINYIKKNSKNYLLSIFIYITFNFYIFTFSGLRQAIAMSILMLSFEFVKKRKFVKFLLMVILASLFHKSALIFLVVYFIANVKINKKYIVYATSIAAILFIFKSFIVDIMINLGGYSVYADVAGGDGYTLLFTFIIMFIFSMLSYKNVDKENAIWYNCLLIAIYIQILATANASISRLVNYFSIVIIVLLPNVIESIPSKSKRILIKMLVIILLTGFYIYSLNNLIYNPYYFFWI